MSEAKGGGEKEIGPGEGMGGCKAHGDNASSEVSQTQNNATPSFTRQ